MVGNRGDNAAPIAAVLWAEIGEDEPGRLILKDLELTLAEKSTALGTQPNALFARQRFGKPRPRRGILRLFGRQRERLVTQKLLDVVKKIAKDELQSEKWLHSVARLSGKSYQAMRVSILEFLDTDVFGTSAENCASFLDPLIESWDIDLATVAMEIVLNRRLISGYAKKFEFVESEGLKDEEEPGLKEFLRQQLVSGDATEEEIRFLRGLKFSGKHPTALYYYRELQNLRDPLHFCERTTGAGDKKHRVSPSPKGQSPRCINTQRLMASRNSCSLTAGKEQYGAGLCVEAVPPKSKKDSLRPGNKQHP